MTSNKKKKSDHYPASPESRMPAAATDAAGNYDLPSPNAMEDEIEAFLEGAGIPKRVSEILEEDNFDATDLSELRREYGADDDDIVLTPGSQTSASFDLIRMYFNDSPKVRLLSRAEEIGHGRVIQEYGPMFRNGVLAPGYSAASIVGLIYKYFTMPEYDRKGFGKLSGFNVRRSEVIKKGPEAHHKVVQIVRGEKHIINDLLTKNRCPKNRRNLRHDIDRLQHDAKETILPFEPTLGRMDKILVDLGRYANRIKAINDYLKSNDADQAKLMSLLMISKEAGDVPDRLPELVHELADIRGHYLGSRDFLAGHNLRLVVAIAKHYRYRGIPFIDLIGHGNEGLMYGMDKWDPEKGYKFSTYTTWWIKQRISRAVADNARTIRLPVHMIESATKLRRARNELANELNRDPKAEELAERAGFSLKKTRMLLRVLKHPASFDRHASDDPDHDNMYNFLGDDAVDAPADEAFESEMIEKVRKAVRGLEDPRAPDMINMRDGRGIYSKEFSPKEIAEVYRLSVGRVNSILRQGRMIDVIKMRHGIGEYAGETHTLEQVGRKHKITRERVRQIESKGFRRLVHGKKGARLENLYEESKLLRDGY
jgi:RNA polymerase primary sigma factor